MTDSITPAMRAQAETVLKKGKVRLAIDHPFFSTMLMKANVTLDDKIPTACVNAHGHIRIGTAFASQRTVHEMMFVLAHEILHPALLHFSRRKHRDPYEWNVAGDKGINDTLKQAGFTLVEGAIYQAGASQHITEDLYKEPDPNGGGQRKVYVAGEGANDMDDSEAMDDATAREVEEQWRVTVAQARNVAKAQGKMPAGLDKIVDRIVSPITPWHKLLERFMTSLVKGDYSWRRPNKRMIGNGLYFPSHNLVPQMGTVVIQSDESGSIGDKEREHFAGHINKILETCRPEKVIVLHTDTQVHKHVDEYTLQDLPIKFTTYCCGGTDMTAGIKWCADNGVEPEVFITLTDGYTPWPNKAPGYPLIWLITTDVKAPVGDTIRYEITD